MISPWEIYWVMQLDSIGGALGTISVGALVTAAVCLVWNGVSKHDASEYPSLVNDLEARKAGWARRSTAARWLVILGLPLLLLNGFLPSSRTAAAMIVIPAIANNETIQREAGELYGLAKEGLRELVKPDAEPAKAEK